MVESSRVWMVEILSSSSSNLNEQRVNYDKKLIKNYYMNEGYYDALVTSSEININKNFSLILFFQLMKVKNIILEK